MARPSLNVFERNVDFSYNQLLASRDTDVALEKGGFCAFAQNLNICTQSVI